MNITVLGANGKTGLEVVNQAIEAGYVVNALVRRTGALEAKPNLNIIIGDATNAEDIAKASKGSNVIISTLGAMSGTLITDSVNAVITSSEATGVKRFILMSSFAVLKDQLGGGTKMMFGLMMGKAVKDKSMSEDQLKNSGLDWTIVYPTILTNAPKGALIRTLDASAPLSMKNKIARSDVAAWMLSESNNNAFVKKEVIITDK